MGRTADTGANEIEGEKSGDGDSDGNDAEREGTDADDGAKYTEGMGTSGQQTGAGLGTTGA